MGRPQEEPQYRWTPVTLNAPFTPRDGAGALVYNDRMWLIGGWNPDHPYFPRICVNDVWSSPDGANWTLEKPNTFGLPNFDAASDWEGRHCAGYVVYKDKMWIVSGDQSQGHYQPDVRTSVDGKTWTQVNRDCTLPWLPRVLQHTVVFRDRIWIMGGQTVPERWEDPKDPSPDAFYNDLWHTADGVRWAQVVPEEPSWCPRGMIGGSAIFRGRMWILGGGVFETVNYPERQLFNDVWSSADGVHWECHVEHAPWQPRYYHEVTVFDDRLWVLEGWNEENRSDVWYSADGITWQEVPGTPWTPRHAASVFVFDGALWMVAGNNMESDVWKLQRADGDRRNGKRRA